MFSHVALGANDLEAARRFYDATLATLGGQPGATDDTGRLVYVHRGALLIIGAPIDGEPACHANGGTIGFATDSTAMVDAWHAAGVAHGGTSVESPPGLREKGPRKLYLAYLRDPAGNKLCAVHRVTA
ncbi:MAG: VOC family protein [Sphingomonadales bacterium]|nr:MAG: VOC family protein [Sphingomonadales bacterium]